MPAPTIQAAGTVEVPTDRLIKVIAFCRKTNTAQKVTVSKDGKDLVGPWEKLAPPPNDRVKFGEGTLDTSGYPGQTVEVEAAIFHAERNTTNWKPSKIRTVPQGRKPDQDRGGPQVISVTSGDVLIIFAVLS